MKRLVSIVLVALSLYSCTDPIDDNGTQDCGSVRNVAYESFNYCGQLKENPTKPTYYLINSNDDLQKLFNTCEGAVLPDFTTKRVLGLSSGPKPTTGYSIKIQSVRENDCQIVVEYFEKEPGDDASIATVMSYPADYIVLPKSDKPIFFSRVNEVVDYVIVASTFGDTYSSNSHPIFKIENQKVLQYLTVNNYPYDFSMSSYKSLVYKDDLVAFLLKIPAEIKNQKGQTKIYGEPNSHDQGAVYFEWSEGGVVTKIYLDNDDTTDQNADIVAFKKAIRDKIIMLEDKI